MKRPLEELEAKFDTKIRSLEKQLEHIDELDVNMRIEVACQMAVNLRVLFCYSGGESLAKQCDYCDKIIFPFRGGAEILNILPTYSMVSIKIKDDIVKFNALDDINNELMIPKLYLNMENWLSEIVINFKNRNYQPLSRNTIIKIIADNEGGAHVGSSMHRIVEYVRTNNVMPIQVVYGDKVCEADCSNLLIETLIAISRDAVFAYKHYICANYKRVGMFEKKVCKIKYDNGNSYMVMPQEDFDISSYLDIYDYKAELEKVVVGIYRFKYMRRISCDVAIVK